MCESDDRALADGLRKRDAQAFEDLFSRYHRMVYNYALHFLNDRQLAEDVLQETFLAVHRDAGRYEERGRFSAWLMGICRNRCLAAAERRSTRQRIVRESGFELLALHNEPSAAAAELARRERTRQVQEALALLPVEQREALLLYASDGLGYADIAHLLDRPLNTVKTLIRRARLRLAAILAQLDED